MKVLSRTADGLERCYNVLLDPEEIEQKKENKLREIAKKMKIDGFRPGKVPINVARRMYGDSVTVEAKSKAIDDTSRKIFADEKLMISFNYATDIIKEDENGLEFTLKF